VPEWNGELRALAVVAAACLSGVSHDINRVKAHRLGPSISEQQAPERQPRQPRSAQVLGLMQFKPMTQSSIPAKDFRKVTQPQQRQG